ncbi:C-terminal binding protein [Jiangella rhizosphaerae]|uniref:C-terminal binding protein n=1 Tax=Jiangella rhizosphaerae TaxID=2293569 RepID=A0A418KIQ6_9ACTN|nr:C-terminal binding protein [Jiangella rhizosphaerae]RIQ13216.1 C-terminal binding protein [Jiangella rhizosphaerae]
MERHATRGDGGRAIAVWAAASPFLPAALETLDRAGVPYVLLPDQPDAAGLARAAGAEALIVGGAEVSRRLLSALPRLRLVVRAGVGTDRIDLDAATGLGVAVTNVPDYATDEVADHAVLLMLAAVRRLAHFQASTRTDWVRVDRPPVMRLRGRRLGIVGLGRIGTATAERARALGMTVAAHDPFIARESFDRAGVLPVSLDELLATSDVISLHAPLTADTHHLLDRAAFARMRRAPVVVNTARGGLVDTAALTEALDAGTVRAAGLDVLEHEHDVARHAALLDRDDVVVTPHVAWYSQGSEEQLGTSAARIALDFVQRGVRPPVLNPATRTEPTSEVTS